MPAKRRKITDHMRRRLVKDVRAGLPLKRAAARAGIPARTFFTWSAKAAGGDPDYVPLFDAIECARAEWMLELVGVVSLGEQGEKGWRAHAWLLEKFFPEARPEQKIEHSGTLVTPAIILPAEEVRGDEE